MHRHRALPWIASAFSLTILMPDNSAAQRSAAGPAPQEPAQIAALKNLVWRSIGPANMGGRVTAVHGVPGNRAVFYIAGADGGIWKTTNAGTTFSPIFENQPVYSIGEIALAPSDPSVIWVGRGRRTPVPSAGSPATDRPIWASSSAR